MLKAWLLFVVFFLSLACWVASEGLNQHVQGQLEFEKEGDSLEVSGNEVFSSREDLNNPVAGMFINS